MTRPLIDALDRIDECINAYDDAFTVFLSVYFFVPPTLSSSPMLDLTPYTHVYIVSYGLACTQGVKSDAGAASEMEEMVVMQNTNYQGLHAELTKSIVRVPEFVCFYLPPSNPAFALSFFMPQH